MNRESEIKIEKKEEGKARWMRLKKKMGGKRRKKKKEGEREKISKEHCETLRSCIQTYYWHMDKDQS